MSSSAEAEHHYTLRRFPLWAFSTLIALGLLILDYFGLFIFLGYTLPRVAGFGALFLSLLSLSRSCRAKARSARRYALILAFFSALLIALPYVATGEAKRFHLAATRIGAGMPVNEVWLLLGAYDSWDFGQGRPIRFAYQVSTATTHCVVVDLTDDRQYVAARRLTFD